MPTRYSAGGSTNAGDAEHAIDCLDHPVLPDPSAFPALAAQAGARRRCSARCWCGPGWGARVAGPGHADPGAHPGAGLAAHLRDRDLQDPVTPYRGRCPWPASCRRGVLVTWAGQSHVAYYYSPCIRALDQAYLIDGTLPAAGPSATTDRRRRRRRRQASDSDGMPWKGLPASRQAS